MFGSSMHSGFNAAAFTAASIPEASPLPPPGASRVAPDGKAVEAEMRKKFKEADDLAGFPAIPRTTQLDGWKIEISNFIRARSYSLNIIFKWIADVSTAANTGEMHWSLGPPELECLDGKLAVALENVIQGESGREIKKMNEVVFRSHERLGGRQVLWLYYHAQKVDPMHIDRYWFQKFEELKINGVDTQALQKYKDQWDYLPETSSCVPSRRTY